ncbi:hypothetical protein FA15DRAFT_143325 [Coprinopsis marcescibilis]|uniref:Uncharacterized protein n=1 Tax=Coprinopsis marcescibilis TaxID=230819 RepID=A0A5C3KVZ5_COPMA|nr:hypothetical protein FA15DRAFT_143325 [Coprinopsis marcescibilis]
MFPLALLSPGRVRTSIAENFVSGECPHWCYVVLGTRAVFFLREAGAPHTVGFAVILMQMVVVPTLQTLIIVLRPKASAVGYTRCRFETGDGIARLRASLDEYMNHKTTSTIARSLGIGAKANVKIAPGKQKTLPSTTCLQSGWCIRVARRR